MAIVRVSAQAYADLRAIEEYIARDNRERAETYVDALLDKAEAIALAPFIHPARDDVGKGLRAVLHPPYLIFFRIGETAIDVLRVVHGARDLRRLFEP